MLTKELLKQVKQIEIKTRGVVNEVFSGEYPWWENENPFPPDAYSAEYQRDKIIRVRAAYPMCY